MFKSIFIFRPKKIAIWDFSVFSVLHIYEQFWLILARSTQFALKFHTFYYFVRTVRKMSTSLTLEHAHRTFFWVSTTNFPLLGTSRLTLSLSVIYISPVSHTIHVIVNLNKPFGGFNHQLHVSSHGKFPAIKYLLGRSPADGARYVIVFL